MSGILIPKVTFAAAINNETIVDVDSTQSVEAIDVPSGTQNSPGQTISYNLLFTSTRVNSATKNVTIRFATALDRDTAKTAFLAAASAAL